MVRERWHVRSLVRRVTGGPPATRMGLRAIEQDVETRAVVEALELALRIGEAMVSLGAAAVDVTTAVRGVLVGFGLRRAQVDLNCVMTGDGQLVEIQGTGEGRAFTSAEQQELVKLCAKGIKELNEIQKEVLGGKVR